MKTIGLLLLILTFSCTHAPVPDVRPQPVLPPLPRISQDYTAKNWKQPRTHLSVSLDTLKKIDEGLAHLDALIAEYKVPASQVFQVHKTRARYLETRSVVLYHLYNISPPAYDYEAEVADE